MLLFLFICIVLPNFVFSKIPSSSTYTPPSPPPSKPPNQLECLQFADSKDGTVKREQVLYQCTGGGSYCCDNTYFDMACCNTSPYPQCFRSGSNLCINGSNDDGNFLFVCPNNSPYVCRYNLTSTPVCCSSPCIQKQCQGWTTGLVTTTTGTGRSSASGSTRSSSTTAYSSITTQEQQNGKLTTADNINKDLNTTNDFLNTGGSKDSNKKSNTAIIAGAVGGIVGLLAICTFLIIGIVLFRRKKNQKQTKFDSVESSSSLELNKVPSSTPPTGNYTPIGSGATLPPTRPMKATPPPPSDKQKKYMINYDELVIEKQIGSGFFGVVYKGTWRQSAVAIKQLHNKNFGEMEMNQFMEEADFMKSMQPHKNVVYFLGICEKPVCIITEYLEKGSLLTLLKSPIQMNMELKLKIIQGIAAGMLHLSLEKIVHKDLAARNVLINENFDAKVSDFGLSKTSEDATGYNKVYEVSETGPVKWMAPESLTKFQYSTKSDVYSFGVTVVEVMTRNEPYPDFTTNDFIKAYVDGNIKPITTYLDRTIPPHIIDLVKKCTMYDAVNRPTFDQICTMLKR